MLNDGQLQDLTTRVASRFIPSAGLERVMTRLFSDSEGNDAVRITLVLTRSAADSLTGDQALDILTKLRAKLFEEGEERFPLVEYATEAELVEANAATRH
jgi:hypothetical protein